MTEQLKACQKPLWVSVLQPQSPNPSLVCNKEHTVCLLGGRGANQWSLHLQVHAAKLSDRALDSADPDWKHGSDIVLKIQHTRMQNLMDSDIRSHLPCLAYLPRIGNCPRSCVQALDLSLQPKIECRKNYIIQCSVILALLY